MLNWMNEWMKQNQKEKKIIENGISNEIVFSSLAKEATAGKFGWIVSSAEMMDWW